jgi:hypothetical protein
LKNQIKIKSKYQNINKFCSLFYYIFIYSISSILLMVDTRQSRRIAIIVCLIGINALVGLATFVGAIWINPTNVRLLISAWSAFSCFLIFVVFAFTIKSTLEYCTEYESSFSLLHTRNTKIPHPQLQEVGLQGESVNMGCGGSQCHHFGGNGGGGSCCISVDQQH